MGNSTEHEVFTELEAAVEKQRETLSGGHEDILDTIKVLRDSLDQLEERERTLTEEAASISDEANTYVQAVKDKVDDEHRGLEELQSDLTAAQQRTEQLEQELLARAELEEKLQDADDKISQLQKAIREQEDVVLEAATAQQRLEKLEETFNEQVDAVQAGQAAKRRVSELELAVDEYKELIETERVRAAELETRFAELEEASAQAAESGERIAKLEAELEDTSRRATDAESSLVKVRKESETYRVEAEELSSQIDESTQLQTQAEEKAAQLEVEYQKIKDDLDSLRSSAGRAAESGLAKAEALELAQAELNKLREVQDANDPPEQAEEPQNTSRALGDKTEPSERVEVKRPASPGEDVWRRMGEILVESGVVTAEQLEEGLEEKQKPGNGNKRLGEVLVELGHTKEDIIAQALAHQSRTEFVRIESGTVSDASARLITGKLAERHTCIPIREEGGNVIVAMVNPLDLIAIEDIERATEMPVQPVVATRSEIVSAISHYFS